VVISHDHCANNQYVLNELANFLPDNLSKNDHLSSYEFNDESIEGQSQDEDEIVNHTRCSNLCSTSYNESLNFVILSQDSFIHLLELESCPHSVKKILDLI
jgi:hypothetical protein